MPQYTYPNYTTSALHMPHIVHHVCYNRNHNGITDLAGQTVPSVVQTPRRLARRVAPAVIKHRAAVHIRRAHLIGQHLVQSDRSLVLVPNAALERRIIRFTADAIPRWRTIAGEATDAVDAGTAVQAGAGEAVALQLAEGSGKTRRAVATEATGKVATDAAAATRVTEAGRVGCLAELSRVTLQSMKHGLP